jgi:hypothetical protein
MKDGRSRRELWLELTITSPLHHISVSSLRSVSLLHLGWDTLVGVLGSRFLCSCRLISSTYKLAVSANIARTTYQSDTDGDSRSSHLEAKATDVLPRCRRVIAVPGQTHQYSRDAHLDFRLSIGRRLMKHLGRLLSSLAAYRPSYGQIGSRSEMATDQHD